MATIGYVTTNLSTLAWGVPVDPKHLGAKVQAYVECSAAITTFNLCAKNSDGKLGCLPPEALTIIVDFVLADRLVPIWNDWDDKLPCCKGNCSIASHQTGELPMREESAADYVAAIDEDTHDGEQARRHLLGGYLEECGDNEKYRSHHTNRKSCFGKMGRLHKAAGNRLYVTYNKCLLEAFGVQMYFTTCWHDRHFLQTGCKENWDIEAYLIAPSHHIGAYQEADEDYSSHYSSMMLDGGYFRQSPTQLRFNFHFAMRVLGIKPSLNRLLLPAPAPTTDVSAGTYHQVSQIAADEEARKAFKKLMEGEWPRMIMIAMGAHFHGFYM